MPLTTKTFFHFKGANGSLNTMETDI